MDHVRYANGEIPQDGWGGFEAYMKKKAAKLASQFQLDAGKCDKNGTSSIFKGVSIYVNGYTDPPAEKLKRLMMMHGGRFIYYPTKANTTHIIASNLAYTKIKELKNEKVVRPAWITDSLKAGKLLPHAPYILYRPKASNQTLHRFADKKLSRLDRVQHATESKGEASSLITNPESVSRNVTSEGYYPSSDHKREKVSKSPTEEETDIARTTDSKPDRCDDVTDTVRKGDTFPAPVIHEGDIPSEKFATHELKRVDRSWSEKLGEKGMTCYSRQKKSANRDDLNCIKTTREIESDRSSKKRVSQEGTKTIVSHTGPVNATASSPSSNEKSPKLKTEECKIDDNSEDITDPPEFGKLYFPKSTDPNFLPSFYRHSSFYHLTTWRAEHRLFVKELHRNSDGTFPSKQKLIAMYGKNRVNSDQKKLRDNKLEKRDSDGAAPEASGEWRVEDDDDDRVMMHIDMDAFFVKVSLLNYPELAGKPVAVAHYAGKPVNKSLKNWNEKSLSQKYSNQKTHCMEFWAGKDKPEILRNGIKGGGEIGDGVDRSDSLPQVHKTEPSPQTLVASESENFSSLAAIASCSYEARLAGVRNGMIMKTAKELCPELRTIPYNFEGYYRVSRQLYEIVAGYTHDIQAASCDEVILDVTNLMEETGATGAEIAEAMREEIYKKTQCTASAGLAPNVILAKLCTKRAKPDGVCTLRREDIPEFLKQAPVGDLPGIGRAFNQKLQSLGIYTCSDLQNVSLKTLQKHFGPKIGQVLYENCRGQDTRPMRSERERKYVSVEVNYGIRFDNDNDAYQFVHRLSEEVNRKLKRLKMVGRTITLKLKVRRAGTPIEDPKFMGYGIYDNKIRSTSLTMETDNSEIIYRACRGLLIQMAVSAKDLRGVGIQMSRLKPPSSMTNKTKSLTEMLPKKGDSPTQSKCPISPKLSPKTKEKPYSLLSFVTKKRVCVSRNSATKMSKAQNVMKKTFAPLNGLPLDGKRLTMRHNENLVAESKGRIPNSSREGLFQKGELSSTDPTNVQRFGSNVGVDKKSIDSREGMKTEDYNKSRVPPEINQGRIKESSFVPKAPKGPVNGVKRALTFDKVETINSTKRRPSNTNTSSMQGNYNNAAMNNINKRRLDVTDRAEMEHCNRVARDNTSRASSANRVVMDGANNGSSDHTRRVAVKDHDKTGLQYTSRAAGDHSNEAGRDPSNRAVTVVANNGSSDHTRRVAVKDNDKTGLQYASRAAGDHSNKAGRDPSNRAVMDGANNGSSDHTRRVAVQNNDKPGLQYTSRAAGDHSNKAAGDHSNKAGRDPSNRAAMANVNRATRHISNRAVGEHSNRTAINNVNRGVMVHRNIGRNNCIDKAAVRQKDRKAMRPSIHATAMDNTNKALRNKISQGKIENSKKGLPLDKDKTKSPKRKTVNQTETSDTIGGGLGKTSSRTPRAMTDKRARYQTIAETTRSKLAVFKREDNKQEKTSAKISTGQNVSVTNGIHGRKELRLPTIKEDDTGSGGEGKLPMNKVVGEKQGPKRTRESNTTDEAGYDVVGTTDCSAAVNGKVVSRKNFTTPRGALTSRNEKKKKYPNGKIDPSVLDSLPAEIQSEVLRESKLGLKNSSDVSDDDRKTKHFDPNQASTSTGITSKLDQEVLQNLPADILQEVVESERCRLKLAQSTPIGGTNQTLGARTAGKRNIPEAFNMKEFAFKKKKCDRKLKIGVKIATDPSTDSLINTNDRKSCHELSTNDDMNIHNFIKEDQHSDEYAETELDPSVIEERETVKSEVVAAEAEKKKISLGGAFTIEDVKNMMKQWMELFASPLDEDISHVVHFMRSHILDQNLEMVFQLLRAFKRMVSTGDSQDWRNAYITVKERIQTTVGHIYGSSLKLDEDL